MPARQTERMTQAPSLTANQTTEVQQILAARDQEMLAMRGQVQSGAATRNQVREQMHAGHAKYDAQFKEMLPPGQYTKYTAMQAQRVRRGDKGPKDGNAKDKGKVKGDKVKTE